MPRSPLLAKNYNSEGEYGVSAGHVAYAAQLKPGVVQVLHEEGTSEPEKYFVAGGYALTHPDSTTVRIPQKEELVSLGLHCFQSDVVSHSAARLLCYRPSPSLQDVVCPEAVKLDDLDSSAISSQFDAAKSAYGAASAGSIEQAEAQIAMEVNKAMGMAVGVNLS